MKCLICETETHRKHKNRPICKDCYAAGKAGRDHLNSTRQNPANKINTEGQDPVTVGEVFNQTIIKQIRKRMEDTNESVWVS